MIIKYFSKIAYPINILKRKKNHFLWIKETNDSFELKHSFTSALILIPAEFYKKYPNKPKYKTS